MKTGKCACKGDFLDRFIQPEILMLLCGQPMHGFSILKEYNRRTGTAEAIDPTGLYRTLKKMEENGLLASDLETVSTSKPRRIYSVTSEGLSCLVRWRTTLAEYRDSISRLQKDIETKLSEQGCVIGDQ